MDDLKEALKRAAGRYTPRVDALARFEAKLKRRKHLRRWRAREQGKH